MISTLGAGDNFLGNCSILAHNISVGEAIMFSESMLLQNLLKVVVASITDEESITRLRKSLEDKAQKVMMHKSTKK